jgi:hypothetical protein
VKFQNVFAGFCIVAVVLAFLYAARPQWFSGLTATHRNDQADVVVRKVQVVLPVGDKGVPTSPDGTDVRQIVDFEEDGLPSRVNSYVLVVNSGNKTFRYYRLTTRVKSVSLRAPSNTDIVSRTSRVLNSNGPIQLELWIPGDRELTLDVEYVANR